MPDLNTYADQLTIETPEQVDLHFPIAGIGSRFLALLADSVLQVTAYMLVIFFFAVALGSSHAARSSTAHTSDTAAKWGSAIFIFLNFLAFWGYFSLFETFWKGQTPGKRLMKLRVIKDSGRSITLFEALARNLIRVIDAVPSFYLVGIIAMLCNKQHQRLGDLVAGTIVVHERVDEQPLLGHNSRTFTAASFAQPPLADSTLPDRSHTYLRPASDVTPELPADAIAHLHPEDLQVLETFFNRALDLTVERRAELAARVAGTMSAKMGVPLPEGVNPERILEQLAHRMRSQGRG
jgi:uncharacterized RDD family membrane protein YckC